MKPVSPTAPTASSLEQARAAYRDISLYSPDRTPCRIDLSDNTNLFGVPPQALATVRGAPSSGITRYPSLYSDRLKRAIAGYVGVEQNNVMTGCGSDDVLDSAIRAFCEPGDIVATCDPSFAMVPLFARMNGLRVVQVPLTSGLDIDADALVAAGAAVTYLCSPNNPTGNAASRAGIEYVIARARGIVVLDEAYAEFARESFARMAPARSRLLVVRTLSKAFGLAGLRIGYGVGSPAVVMEVEKSRGPYKVSSIAEEAAVCALQSDLAWVRERIADAVANRERFSEKLRGLGLAPLPSESNFVLVPVENAGSVANRMRSMGVAVRPFRELPIVGDALRISAGPWPMMEEALGALEASLK